MGGVLTLTQNHKHLHTGIAGSLLIHGALLLLFATGFSLNASRSAWLSQEAAKEEKEVTLLFPDQFVTPPPAVEKTKPKPKAPPPKAYVRTTQNEAAPKAPAKATFQSDRNTVAASAKAPAPDGMAPMPTMAGIDKATLELKNRDYRDGKVKDEQVVPASLPQMRAPQQPTVPPTTVQVAKARQLPKMMEEMEQDSAPLEIKKANPATATAPPTAEDSKPSARESLTAKLVMRADADVFTPFTRTGAVKGTLTNRGDNAVDAEQTPMGVFMRHVTGAVESKWHHYRRQKDAVAAGTLKVRFYVNKAGKAEDMSIISDLSDADPRMAEFTLQAIRDADLPSIPSDLMPMLDGERVKIEYDVVIY